MSRLRIDSNDSVIDVLAQTLATPDTCDLRASPGETPLPPDDPARGRYLERGELGRGGLGVVVEAFDRDLRRAVALKRPRDDRPTTAKHVGALVREAQLTAQLEHPNIIAVHGLGIDPTGRPYFTMTRLRARSLADMLRAPETDSQRLTTGQLLRIFLQVAYAVAYAHSRGVLHRDLKPENVIVGEYGEVRLIDWGLAMLLDRPDEEARRDETGGPPDDQPRSFVGTVGYASPEQATSAPDLDCRSDVFSLGALLYALLAGRPPIVARSPLEHVLQLQRGKITPIQSLTPISIRLAAIIHKALAIRREDRYPSAMDLLKDVEAHLEGRAVSARPEGAIERMSRWYAGRPAQLARLHTYHVDLLTGGWMFAGFGAGCWWAAGFRLWTLGLILLGLAMIAPAIYTLSRKPRPDDPDVLIPYSGGMTSGPSTEPPQ